MNCGSSCVQSSFLHASPATNQLWEGNFQIQGHCLWLLDISTWISTSTCYLKCKSKTKLIFFFFFFFKILFIFRERGRRKRGRETSVHERYSDHLSPAPSWGPGLQPRHVPWLGIKLVGAFGSQASTRSTEPHQSGPNSLYNCSSCEWHYWKPSYLWLLFPFSSVDSLLVKSCIFCKIL